MKVLQCNLDAIQAVVLYISCLGFFFLLLLCSVTLTLCLRPLIYIYIYIVYWSEENVNAVNERWSVREKGGPSPAQK